MRLCAEKNAATREETVHKEGQPQTLGMTMTITQATRDGKLYMGATCSARSEGELPDVTMNEVVKSSPAHRAGLHEGELGDRVLRMNGNTADGTPNELQAWWKQMMQRKQVTMPVARTKQGNTGTKTAQSSGKRNRWSSGKDPTAHPSPPQKRHQQTAPTREHTDTTEPQQQRATTKTT